MTSAWWKPRQEGEATNKYLERVLRAVRLHDLADQAAKHYFDDYLTPTHLPWAGMEHAYLAGQLQDRANKEKKRVRAAEILAVRQGVIDGEFDATKEESDAWAASPEGQALMAEFPPDLRKKLFGV